MRYSAKSVANYFLDKGEAEGIAIDPMKLQKLVYYAHGWHWGLKGRPLLDETVEAWRYGPVVPSLYAEFVKFGNRPITRRAERYTLDEASGELRVERPRVSSGDVATRELLQSVWDVYKRYTGVRLSNSTHVAGSPWEQTVREYGGDPPRGLDIPEPEIHRFFAERVASRA